MQTSGSGNIGASADSRLGLPMRSGATYSTLTLPSCMTTVDINHLHMLYLSSHSVSTVQIDRMKGLNPHALRLLNTLHEHSGH